MHKPEPNARTAGGEASLATMDLLNIDVVSRNMREHCELPLQFTIAAAPPRL
jgi:hypothetical protein